SCAGRDQIHGAKSGSLRWVWVGDTNQLHKSICGTYLPRVGLLFERVAEDRSATRWKLSCGAFARECADRVPPSKQLRDQSSAHKACSAGDEHLALCGLGEGMGIHRASRLTRGRFFGTLSPLLFFLSARETVEKTAQTLPALRGNWQAAAQPARGIGQK